MSGRVAAPRAGTEAAAGVSLATSLAADASTPPIFWIAATSYYEAGFKHGQVARERIEGWLATAEMQALCDDYAGGAGRDAFEQLIHDNSLEFPEYVKELRGIADGAHVPMHKIWCATLINEMSNLKSIDTKHPNLSWNGGSHPHNDTHPHNGRKCSDIYAVSPGGFAEGFAHGHNDDWSDDVKPFWYFLAYSVNPEAAGQHLDFEGCAGLAYPGSLNVGWAPTWNRHGIVTSQNTLTPTKQRRGGLASAFVQRRAICPARNMDEALRRLTKGGWSDGASMNVVDTRGSRMANVEIFEDLSSVQEVTSEMGNYSHFNDYKHLTTPDGEPIDDPTVFVRDPRQGRVNSLPAPHSELDVRARLSNDVVFKPHATIVTVVVNGATGALHAWCAKPSAFTDPDYSWNLHSFFDEPAQHIQM